MSKEGGFIKLSRKFLREIRDYPNRFNRSTFNSPKDFLDYVYSVRIVTKRPFYNKNKVAKFLPDIIPELEEIIQKHNHRLKNDRGDPNP